MFEPAPGMIERLVMAVVEDGPPDSPSVSLAAQLRAGDEVIGSLGVAGELAYSEVDRQLLTSLADAVAPAIEVVQVRHEQDQMLEGLSRLQAELQDVERVLRSWAAEDGPTADGGSQ
jgi:hypothetical protein